jgi:hypothetical protein
MALLCVCQDTESLCLCQDTEDLKHKELEGLKRLERRLSNLEYLLSQRNNIPQV